MIASPSPARPSLRPLCAALLLCGASGALADTVTLIELPAPEGYAVAGVSNITADGTVIGVVYPDGFVVRWQPGATPEVLGGGLTFTLDNITPLISKDGSAIATTGYFDDGGEAPVAAPELWTGGTDWARIGGASATLGNASVFGVSYDGSVLTGSAEPAVPPPEGPWPQLPWSWTAAGGQVPLALPVDGFSAQAWAASNDGRVVAGFGEPAPDDFTRYGLRWDDGVPSWITDGNGQRVGQAIGCNSDCSVIVGAGVENGLGDPRAWRWRAGIGLDYLDLPEGAQAGAVTYAFESSEDGDVVVGSYVVFDPNLGPTNHGFYWTAADGPQDITAFLAGWGIEFGASDWVDLLVNGVTPDGHTLLLNGLDANYLRRRAVVQIAQDDWIFADGFEGFGPLRAR
ncbi:putative membrane protein [Dokdonella fugitiva]|uniref:Putative membrane protein n=1 Tax=Dokdonella fugitiva TaxID=328517 RepID=A0A839F393_9GAMM|nr:hypothetical protein [Dokdonella fugitiva]MBA8889523.1 putative membrane protein [Dokdonella fugitiva]